MRVVPLCYASFLTSEQVDHHECSDRIWVPRHMFERWLTAEDAGSVVIVKLQDVAACIYGPHGEAEDILYAPTWMCSTLRVSLDPPMEDEDLAIDDYIEPLRFRPDMCTHVKLQPHTSDHIRLVEEMGVSVEDVLSRALEEYTCLMEGQTLTLHLENGSVLTVDVLEALPRPTDGMTPLCIRSTEITLDLEAPLDRPATPLPTRPVGGSPPPWFTVPTLPSTPLQPLPPSPPSPPPMPSKEERRALMAAAAMRRLAFTSNEVTSS
jgi:hypothetical protein